jgi:cbb3-type cytochrome oxidase maturation protein
MSAIIILLLVSISIAGSFLLAFFWSVRDGQFDDDYSPPRRILFDDTKRRETSYENRDQKSPGC